MDRRAKYFKNWLTSRADWYDGQFTARPVYNQNGGEVPGGFVVTFSPPPGTIYYTTDGSDPRLPGGGVSPDAQQYDGGVAMTKVVSEGDAVRVIVPTASTPPSGSSWPRPNSTTTGWQAGTSRRGLRPCQHLRHPHQPQPRRHHGRTNTSAYLRLEFNLPMPRSTMS